MSVRPLLSVSKGKFVFDVLRRTIRGAGANRGAARTRQAWEATSQSIDPRCRPAAPSACSASRLLRYVPHNGRRQDLLAAESSYPEAITCLDWRRLQEAPFPKPPPGEVRKAIAL